MVESLVRPHTSIPARGGACLNGTDDD